MEAVKLQMVLESLENIKDYPLPEGYYFKFYTPGDENRWVEIELAAGGFENKQKAEEMFARDFVEHLDILEERQLYLCSSEGELVGTTTAWMTENFEEGIHGLIHWVAIKPEHQAKRLGRPLLSAALKLMRNWHTKAFLSTNTECVRAVRVYLDMGFVPYIIDEDGKKAWQKMANLVHHPTMEQYKA